MSKDKNIAPRETTVPAPNTKAKGFEEGYDNKDLIIPRVKLLQAQSPEVTAEDSTLKAGQIINSLTKEVLPNLFVPIFFGTNWIKFNPRDVKDPTFNVAYEPGATIHRTKDPNDPIVIAEGEFGANGEKPTITKFLNFFCYFPGVKFPLIMSFSKTSYKTGKELLSLARFFGDDMFNHQYKVVAKRVEDNAHNSVYYVYKVEQAGAADEVSRKVGDAWHTQFRQATYKVHDEEGAAQE